MTRPIIIAVEDANILYLLQRYAEECGFRAVSAWPAADVLDLAQCINPALIILDATQSGAARQKLLLQQLHSGPDTQNVPVILYSSADCPAGNWDAGVAAYLPKSVRYDDFLAALKHIGVYANDR